MTHHAHDPIESDPEVDPSERLDTDYSPSNERDTEALQDDQDGSAAFDDPGIDRSEVHLLPGTGDPDDPGDIEPQPGEIHMPSLPGRTGDGPPS